MIFNDVWMFVYVATGSILQTLILVFEEVIRCLPSGKVSFKIVSLVASVLLFDI